MKKQTKKLISIVGIVVVTLGIVLTITKLTPQKETTIGAKTITIIIEDRQDETKELLNKAYNTNSEYLGQLLDENAEELQINLSEADPSWGRTIYGLMDLTTPDMSTGPWWMYTINGQWADAIDMCVINDGDIVVFYFTSSY